MNFISVLCVILIFYLCLIIEVKGKCGDTIIDAQVTKIQSLDSSGNDYFGYDVSIHGDNIVLGAIWDGSSGYDAGAAYVFERNYEDGYWYPNKIISQDIQIGDEFGKSVAIYNDTIVIGVPFEDGNGAESGSAYVFQKNEFGNFVQVKKIQSLDNQGGDQFGMSVSIFGDTIVIGAPTEDTGGNDKGSVYVFERNEGGIGNWGQVKKLQTDNAANTYFGSYVAISGDTIVSGIYTYVGSVYVFERNEGGVGNWGQVKKIQPVDNDDNFFGEIFAISDDTIVVGVPQKDTGGSNAGCAYVFERNELGVGNWGQVKKLQSSDIEAGDQFGNSVSVSRDIIVIGAFKEGLNAGSAYVFKRNEEVSGKWEQVKKLQSITIKSGDYFGSKVSISGNTIVIGEETSGPNADSAYIFELYSSKENCFSTLYVILASVVATGALIFFAACSIFMKKKNRNSETLLKS